MRRLAEAGFSLRDSARDQRTKHDLPPCARKLQVWSVVGLPLCSWGIVLRTVVALFSARGDDSSAFGLKLVAFRGPVQRLQHRVPLAAAMLLLAPLRRSTSGSVCRTSACERTCSIARRRASAWAASLILGRSSLYDGCVPRDHVGRRSFGGEAGPKLPRPTSSHFVDLRGEGGLRHHILEWGRPGDGPLLLFMHANSLCAGIWGPVVQRLPFPVHAVACDLRAHGRTDVPAAGGFAWMSFGEDLVRLAGAVQRLYGCAPRACVTHSFSGDAALMALAESQGDVGRMILLDPVLADAEGASSGAQRLAQGTRRLHEKEAEGFASAEAVGEGLERLLRGALARGALHPESKVLFAEFGAAPDDAGRWRLMCDRNSEAEIYANRVAIADHLEGRRVAVDAQIVFASKRRGKPEHQEATLARDWRVAERVAAACRPGSSVHLLDGVGHFLPLEDPQLVAEQIARLL